MKTANSSPPAHDEIRLLQAQKRTGDRRKSAQVLRLLVGKIPGPAIEDAEAADGQVLEIDGRAGVKAEVRASDHIRSRFQFTVFRQIPDNEEFVREDDPRADGHLARAFADPQARLTGDPLPVFVDDVDGGVGNVEDAFGKLGQGCEFGRGSAAD
jgi:hypothetical protein